VHLFSKKRAHVYHVLRLLNEQNETIWRLSTEKGFKAKRSAVNARQKAES